MKHLVPIPSRFVDQLKIERETGPGYQVVSLKLKDGRFFDQVVTSEGHIIEVQGHTEIPFVSEEIVSIKVNHKDWNFREWSDAYGSAKATMV